MPHFIQIIYDIRHYHSFALKFYIKAYSDVMCFQWSDSGRIYVNKCIRHQHLKTTHVPNPQINENDTIQKQCDTHKPTRQTRFYHANLIYSIVTSDNLYTLPCSAAQDCLCFQLVLIFTCTKKKKKKVFTELDTLI